ncbi:transcriptional regulator containing PAS, AAA-type ATPase, and DNA-binding domains [Desulfosporosinus acidiphilus SJ4]|uniref:Transcriptional regulator containing PAS, AAA-type ATPase, and DNA-binding domains n=1 Tax=Desulfosporosinus acidiphilus (strain DSM 22704 / JCM 16185 / SJ4) TaxID=646529 RepID=I4D4E7_DESAJ|nr:sigma 54-interacting transcriptional regulator [Desulfosporosinus acidiphilus]AFM40671.1 transcriptional regulator containing PAS, AAA-type ATPase, and DNA-binding domains [Desulfosporosinus acidiphilus SJ4]
MPQESIRDSLSNNVVVFPLRSTEKRFAVTEGSAVPKYKGDYSTFKDGLEGFQHNDKIGIYITDGQGYTLGVNSTYEKLTGIKITEIQGKHMSKLVKDGLFDRSVTLMVLQSGKAETISQQIIRTNQMVCATGNPIFNDFGEIINVMTTVRPLGKGIIQSENYDPCLIEGVGSVIAQSQIMRDLLKKAIHLANFESNILIEGPTGAGKEVIAKTLHYSGLRKNGPFIKVNMSALPEDLVESELFGYEGGAFTGAKKQGKEGLIKAAHHGTLFLDEIGEMPKNLQVKLLRVLQERELTPLGSTRPIPVDCRVIAATNRNLQQSVREGTFREDLFYRLNVIYLRIPGLSERPEDVIALATHFVSEMGNRLKVSKTLTNSALRALTSYSWPGNVRELQNLIERLIVLHPGNLISETHISEFLGINLDRMSLTTLMERSVVNLERKLILEAIKAANGDKAEAAKALGIHRTTLSRKMQRYGLL